MKFLLSLALAGVALAQNARIGLPAEGQRLARGSNVVVQVQRPNSLTGSKEMAVAIGINPCSNGRCLPATDVLGTVLYNGPFNPVYHESALPPYQNFTVTIPEGINPGSAQLNVAHASLIGAGPMPYLEGLNQTVTVA